MPRTLEQQFILLAEYLQRQRFLLVLDNAESILTTANATNHTDYAAYRQLWQLFMQRDHQCCLLLTSSEEPPELHSHKEQPGVFRQLVLDGMAATDGEQLLKCYGLQGTNATFTTLHQRYSGNPLALALVAEAIDELFAGDIRAFLQEETPFFGDIGTVLDQQFARLSPLECELLTWLALEQEPISSQQLWSNLVAPPSKRDYLTALRTLLQRALIQQHGSNFGVQNVILEYARNRLVEEIGQELIDDADLGWMMKPAKVERWQDFGVSAGGPLGANDDKMNVMGEAIVQPWLVPFSHSVTLSKLNRYALSKAQAKDHIRAGQRVYCSLRSCNVCSNIRAARVWRNCYSAC